MPPPEQSRLQPARTPNLVLGLGNILLRDEGVGVRVVQAMQGMDLPADVEVFDGATAGLDLLDVLADRRKVVVIDALAGETQPATILRLETQDLAPPESGGVSLHEIGLLETLAAARLLGSAPRELVIIGVAPRSIDWGLELTPEIARLVPRIIELALAEFAGSAVR